MTFNSKLVFTLCVQFGCVVDVEWPWDKRNNALSKFCFVEFDKDETGKKLIDQGSTTFNGNKLFIRSVSISMT